jgi:hypothetical protein
MINKKSFIFGILLALLLPGVLAAYGGPDSSFSGSTNSWQSYQPTFDQLYSSGDVANYWPILRNIENDQCNATSDFIIGIPPGGCTPTVVRSDLLEEQNVPVFCQLYAIQINPLIKVSSIKSISFRGDYPEGVAGLSYHPARAAVKSYRTLLGDPMINNIGYVVIILKREKVEANMEDWIAGNLTASIRYDAIEAYGTGKGEYYLTTQDAGNWDETFNANSFWNGRGYLKLESAGDGEATIQLLTDKEHIYRTMTLKDGETSGLMYFPGYYCRAGLRVKLNGLVAPEDAALLQVDGNDIWVREGSELLDGKCKVRNIEVEKNHAGNIKIVCTGQTIYLKVSAKKEGDSKVEDISNPNSDSYFDRANLTIDELIENYPHELKASGMQAYGEEALYDQIKFAESIGKFKTQAALMDLFVETYPTSDIVDKIRTDRQRLGSYDYSEAYKKAFVTNDYFDFSVKMFKDAGEGESKVDLKVRDRSFNSLKEGDKIELGVQEYILVDEIIPGKVSLKYFNENANAEMKQDPDTISDGEYGSLGGWETYVKNVEVTEVAYVSLIPEVKNTKTEANFTFRIGIEKRAIELTPEKTKEMLKNLNETIAKWEKINDRMKLLIKGWKGACFATSAVLMIKNMATGLNGEALARQKVMEKYKQKCALEYPEMTRTQCYNALAPEINADVSSMATALKNVNGKMDTALENNKNAEGLFGQATVTNQAKYVEDLKGQLPAGWSAVVNGQTVTAADLTTSSQVRAAMLYSEMSGQTGTAFETAKKEMEDALSGVALSKKAHDENLKSIQELASQGITDAKVQTYLSENTRLIRWDGQVSKGIPGVPDGKNVQYLNYNGRVYLLVLGSSANSAMGIDSAYTYDAASKSWTPASPKPSEFERIVLSASSAKECSNPWPAGTAKVSYYETGSNNKLPAIVPFELKNGWYAMVPNSGGTFLEDSPKGYTASADVSYFKICNIGTNGLMEKGIGDDLCQSFDINTAGVVDKFIPCPLMSSSEVRELYTKAREAIRQASQQYSMCAEASNKKDVVLTIVGSSVGCGAPMSDVGDFECQDFMSPEDCKTMFNVCDPVICPASRCDLGGKYPVSDVIQTGIIGSIMLCLPNAKEGIIVPICVSGIQAGLDALVSILKSERDCLERSLETGEHVGICDQITSIYLCEFFWRQLSPVMDILIPRLIEGFGGGSGQSVRGGGEYLLVQQSWTNMQNSIDYFKNTYAQNAFRAFNVRNVAEAGTQVCRAFVGTSFPTSADALDSLLEPESPSQFYAYFSETAFTEATVPATAQYKVYYHIYAGNDKGVQYQVYLKNPPESSYYRSNPYISVKTGYISKGGSADESIDFTAPAGYKELCVVIDAKEECGFKQVSTDFGLDYVEAKYTQEQAETSGITSEKECISGSPSALPLVTPNIQAGVEESFDSEIALRGIVRVCASANPDAGVAPENYLTCLQGSKPNDNDGCGNGYKCNTAGYCVDNVGGKQRVASRWKDVGYCGDTSVRCWLDTSSVKQDLKTVAAIENSSISLLEEQKGLIENTRMTLEDVRESLARVSKMIEELKSTDLQTYGDTSTGVVEILKILNSITGTEDSAGAGTNADRAEALALRASLYRRIAEEKYKMEVPKSTPSSRPVGNDAIGSLAAGDLLEDSTGKLYEVTSAKFVEADWVVALVNPSDITDMKTIKGPQIELISYSGYKRYSQSSSPDTTTTTKLSWGDLVNEGYGSSKGTRLFISFQKEGSPLPVKGAFDYEGQKVVIINAQGQEEVYMVARQGQDIIFTRAVLA